MMRHRVLLVGLLAFFVSSSAAVAQPPGNGQGSGAKPAQADPGSTPPSGSKFKSPDDGWFDMGGFLDTKFGFLPVATAITEPSVGLGAAGGLAFINKPLVGEERPDITFGGGFGTENGTKGVVAGDLHHWLDGRLQTVGAVLWASVNLDYYGLGDDSVLADNPLRYNLEPAGVLGQVKHRLGATPLFAGVRYSFGQIDVSFDAPPATPGLPAYRSTSKVGGLAPSITLDSRDNIFTPTRGSYVEGTVSFFSGAFGGDDTFQTFDVIGMYYVPLPPQLFFGVRGELSTSSDDTPFYMRPFVYQRGVPAMRYLGEETAQIEGEVRWQFWKRLSAVAFGGVGSAWTGFERIDNPNTVGAGGGGFRYELARRYGMHAGFDIAYGPDGAAFYIQWGSAWMRP
jgi:hypothetical protein